MERDLSDVLFGRRALKVGSQEVDFLGAVALRSEGK